MQRDAVWLWRQETSVAEADLERWTEANVSSGADVPRDDPNEGHFLSLSLDQDVEDVTAKIACRTVLETWPLYSGNFARLLRAVKRRKLSKRGYETMSGIIFDVIPPID